MSSLHRELVVKTAAELADAEGWAALTMSRLAKELDRHVSTLYAHVESLADLRREVALLAMDELAEEVWRAALGAVKGDALRAIAVEYLAYARRHPGRVAAMVQVPPDDEVAAKGVRLAEPVRATFRSFGLDDDAVVTAHGIFSALVTGFAARGGDVSLDPAVDLFVVALESGRWPG